LILHFAFLIYGGYWRKELGCTKKDLAAAVKKAGVNAAAVRKFLGR